ncbi:MAG: TonB family protein [Bdellovibrionaceae bacterium]|nr:TonB family protein [Pseudobdellovibrionaceae bacterium]
MFGHEGEVHVDLPDSSVSPIHALIELRDSGYYICDLGSQSGTTKNGKPILDEPISSGDQIGFGPFTIHFFVGVPKPKAPPSVTVPGATPTPPAALDATTEKTKNLNPNEGLSTTPQIWAVQTPPAAKATTPQAPPSIPSQGGGGLSVATVTTPASSAPPKLPDSVRTPSVGGTHKTKHKEGFAPPSEIKDLRDYLRPTKGPIVEVITAWRERILQTHHFVGTRVLNLGPKGDVFAPIQYVPQPMPFIELQGGTRIFVPDSVTAETINLSGRADMNELQRQGKATRQAAGTAIRLDQGDLVAMTFGDGNFQIFVRFVPAAPVPILASPINLSAGELTAMVGSIILAILFSVYVSTLTPPEQPKPEEEMRVAQFVYNKPTNPTPTPTPTPPPPPQPTPPPPPRATPTPRPTPTPPPKVIKVSETAKAAQAKNPSQAATAERAATRAAEVRPKPSLDRQKTMTSTRQGGAVKMGEKAGANAQSAKDVTKTGLLSAFGGGGINSKLDKAYSGAGELLGMADKSSGTSGQNENRAGDGIGSRFKDSGAGGKGTATEGIAGVGTKGRAGGTSAYGGIGSGGKGSVAIDAGGSEEVFEGSIDREAVRRVIRSILSQIKSCYERRLRNNSGLEGKVVIRFVIEEQGRVRRADTKSSTLNDRDVEACVAMRIREQRFPDPPAGTIAEVDYPFVFGMQK